MRILVAGTGQLGAAILEPLLESRHHVAGVLLNGNRVRGRWRRFQEISLSIPDTTVRIAKRWGLPLVWLDQQSPASMEAIAALEPDLLITCGFGIILKRPLLELPRIGCINVHSSLLPKHRGPMPFNWVIRNGDTHTGVTFHVTTPKIDAGDILDQRPIPVTDRDTALSVYRRCCELARVRIEDVIEQIETHGLAGEPQDEREATYDPPMTDADLRIDWSLSAADIDRQVRAGTPVMPAHFEYRRRPIHMERAKCVEWAGPDPPGTVLAVAPQVTVATGAGAIAIVRAHTARPIEWPWPNAWSRVTPGAVLD